MSLLCPIAVVSGCEKCPFRKFCPLKDVIGDTPKSREDVLKKEKSEEKPPKKDD